MSFVNKNEICIREKIRIFQRASLFASPGLICLYVLMQAYFWYLLQACNVDDNGDVGLVLTLPK